MSMLVWDTVLAVFATGAILDVWFNGSIFSTWQAELQFIADEEFPKEIAGEVPMPPEHRGGPQKSSLGMVVFTPTYQQVIHKFLAKLLTCSFCLSYHVPFWFLAPLVIGANSLDASHPVVALLLRFPLYWLAIVRIGNLLDGFLPNRLRYKQVLEFNHVETQPPEETSKSRREHLQRGGVISRTVPGPGISFRDHEESLAKERELEKLEDELAAGFTAAYDIIQSHDNIVSHARHPGYAASELSPGPGAVQPVPTVREGSPQAGTGAGHDHNPPELGSPTDR